MICTNPFARSKLISLTLAAMLIVSGCSVSYQRQQEKITKETAVESAISQKSESAKSPNSVVTAKSRNPLILKDLMVREERGETKILIKFSQPISQFRHFPLPSPARIVLDILGTGNQPGQTETYRIETRLVGGVRVAEVEDGLRITTDVAAATVPEYSVVPEDDGLRISVGTQNYSDMGRKEFTILRNGIRADIRAENLQDRAQRGAKSTGDEKRYSGEKISLDFKDADIKNVFRLLGEVSGKNIIITDDVNRKISIRLIEVPWDQAMDVIVDTNGLGKDEIGNVIRISTAGRLKAERDALAAAKKSEENLEPLQTAYLTLNYAKVMKGQKDINTDKDLVEKVKAVLSPRGRVEADQRTNTLIVRDIKPSIDDVQTLINRLDTRTPQVLIESNLIETTPTFSRALGVELDTVFNDGRVRTATRFQAGPPFTGSPIAVFPPNTSPIVIPSNGFRFGYFANNVAGVLSAAEAEGNIKIISRPSIVTLNNVESTIESANIIRVRTTAATVGEAGSLREIRAGITLKVTPQVSADGFVLLNIEAKSSTLDFANAVENIPAEISREAKANVLVRDGETVVIGGIMKDTSSNSDSGVPYLKDVPVLGWLFKKSSWRKDFEELVVFITPRIIAAGSEDLPNADQLWRDQLKATQGRQAGSVNP